MKSGLLNTLKLHPVSTVLLIFYTIVSVLFGNLSLFLMGFLAASAAYVLELLFCVTGMIRTGRYCAGRPGSSYVRNRQRQNRLHENENAQNRKRDLGNKILPADVA